MKFLIFFLRGMEHYNRFKRESNIRAGDPFEKAIGLDSGYPDAYGLLGWVRLNESRFRWVEDPAQSFKQAEKLAIKSISIRSNTHGHDLLMGIYTHKGKYDEAIAEGKRSVTVSPNSSGSYAAFAWTMIYAAKPKEALTLSKKALRLSPYPPAWYLTAEGFANYLLGHYKAALSSYQKVLKRYQSGSQAHIAFRGLIVCYMQLGREAEARTEAQNFLKLNPTFTIKIFIERIKGFSFRDLSWVDKYVDLLRKAGLPE